MPLSKAKRKQLRDAGMSSAELTKLEGILDAEDGDADNGSKPKGSRRVVVYEGEDAERVIRSMFGGKADSGENEGDEDDEDDEGDEGDDDEGETEGDDKPKGRTRWFG